MPGSATTILHLVRHGQRADTDPAWRPKVCQHTEVPLSPLGEKMADATGRRLAGEGIRVIYCSPYLRAVQTAAAIARHTGLRIFIEPGVMEHQNINWFPRRPPLETVAALAKRFPAIDPSHRTLVRPVWPETKEEVLARLKRSAQAIVARGGGSVLVVGHGMTVFGMATALLDPPYPVDDALCGLTRLVLRPRGWRLQLNGVTDHLRRLGGELH